MKIVTCILLLCVVVAAAYGGPERTPSPQKDALLAEVAAAASTNHMSEAAFAMAVEAAKTFAELKIVLLKKAVSDQEQVDTIKKAKEKRTSK